ncbi:phenylalanine--tRNA ligase subunit beta [Candidatus Epulonipiscioides gigas]|nr:phenylalanine--tRNA ligase subunit beta [Epulopiscium sp. SCG-C07WGA-EpuloA2]
MNVPMSWLKEYVNINVDLKTFVDKMTLTGSKVEKVEESGKEITNVVIGKVIAEEKHPDADRLRVMKCDIGTEVIQIVTAATNIQVGDIIPVALNGATLANGLKIKKGKLRGVESNGMFCSVEELGLTKEQFPDAPDDGIYIFHLDNLELGEDAKPYFGLGEQVVEYEITSNRPDCFSILGIATEAAATFNTPFLFPKIEVKEIAEDGTKFAKINIQEPALCNRYAARIIKNVHVKNSPKWLQDKLISAGLRPINNIVDITNYLLLEFGQPMHAFDYDKLVGKEINVRLAQNGEELKTLLGDTVKLDDTMLVIADKEKPIAIAGVMGGEDTKVTEETKTILFECANFNAFSVRQTSKKLGIMSDSSKKYVKGLDPENISYAVNRAAQLINMTESGDVLSGIIDIYPIKRTALTIGYDVDWINSYLGINISKEEMEEIFTRVRFVVNKDNTVTIPTSRPDVTMNADLAEEVARIYGYDKIPVTLERATPTVGGKTYEQQTVDKIKNTLRNCGAYGILTYTIESPKVFDKLNIAENSSLRNALKIQNPLGEDFSILRTTTINSILNVLSTNNNKRNENVALYEVGKVFLKTDKDLPNEVEKITVGLYGTDADFFTIKGIAETLIKVLNIKNTNYTRNQNLNFMHPGRCANLLIGKKEVGFLGEVHPEVLKNYGFSQKAYVLELDLKTLIDASKTEIVYKSLPKFPSITRDLALLVNRDILVGDMIKLINERGGKILVNTELFDVYEGEQVNAGQKSVAFNLIFRAEDKTLTDEEVQKSIQKILNGLETNFNAKLR